MKPGANIHVYDDAEINAIPGTTSRLFAIQWPNATVSISDTSDIIDREAASFQCRYSRVLTSLLLEPAQLLKLRDQIDAALAEPVKKAQAA